MPSERLDPHSLKQVERATPYESYWLGCIDRMLEFSEQNQSVLDFEEPGYYKVVCERRLPKKFPAANYPHFNEEELRVTEACFLMKKKVQYDVFHEKIHQECRERAAKAKEGQNRDKPKKIKKVSHRRRNKSPRKT